jgi:hypothetical protein
MPTSNAVFGTIYGSPYLSFTRISSFFASSKRFLLWFGFSSVCLKQSNQVSNSQVLIMIAKYVSGAEHHLLLKRDVEYAKTPYFKK